MKDLNTPKNSESTAANPGLVRRTMRSGAKALVQRFKERQRLPVITMLGESKDWLANAPANEIDIGSFYRL